MKQLPLHFSELFLSFHEYNLAIGTKIWMLIKKIYPVQLCTFHHGQQHHNSLDVICRAVINSAPLLMHNLMMILWLYVCMLE